MDGLIGTVTVGICASWVAFLVTVTLISLLDLLTELVDSDKLEEIFTILLYATPFIILTFLAFLFPNEMINLLKLVLCFGPLAIPVLLIMALFSDSSGGNVAGVFCVVCVSVLFSEIFSVSSIRELFSESFFSEIISASFLKLMVWAFLNIIVGFGGFLLVEE